MGHIAGNMCKWLMLEFCINVAFSAVMWKHLKHFCCHRIHLFSFYFLLLSQTLRLFSEMSLFMSNVIAQVTYYSLPSSVVVRRPLHSNFLISKRPIVTIFGTLFPLRPHRQGLICKKVTFSKKILLYSKTCGKN